MHFVFISPVLLWWSCCRGVVWGQFWGTFKFTLVNHPYCVFEDYGGAVIQGGFRAAQCSWSSNLSVTYLRNLWRGVAWQAEETGDQVWCVCGCGLSKTDGKDFGFSLLALDFNYLNVFRYWVLLFCLRYHMICYRPPPPPTPPPAAATCCGPCPPPSTWPSAKTCCGHVELWTSPNTQYPTVVWLGNFSQVNNLVLASGPFAGSCVIFSQDCSSSR